MHVSLSPLYSVKIINNEPISTINMSATTNNLIEESK